VVDIIQTVGNLDNIFPLWDGGPSRIWSLLNMLIFMQLNFKYIIGTITALEFIIRKDEEVNISYPMIEQIGELYNMLDEMKLILSAKDC